MDRNGGRSLALAALLTGCIVRAQTTAPPSAPSPPDLVLHIDVNLVQVDAVVYDRGGHPVTDLQPSDFELYEDGKPQTITAFSYVQNSEVKRSLIPHDRASKRARNDAPPPAKLHAANVKRTIVLVADDLALSWESTAFLRRALKRYIDTEVGPDDLVSIARTSTGMGALENFTNDKSQLYAAMDAIRWNLNGLGAVNAFEPQTPGVSAIDPGHARPLPPINPEQGSGPGLARIALGTDSEDQEIELLYVRGTVSSLNAIIRNLRDLPGRKAVIFFADGIALTPRGENLDVIWRMLHEVADAANRSSVVLNCVDTRGLQSGMANAADNFGSAAATGGVPGKGGVATAEAGRRLAIEDSQTGLIFLANQTGGRVYLNGNDLNWAIDRALDDLNGYYLLGFRPAEGTFHKPGEQAKFHRLKLRVKRRGVSWRSRSGFFGMTDEETNPEPDTDGRKLFTALQSPFGASDIPLKLTTQFLSDGAGKNTISTLLHIDLHAVHFDQGPDSHYRATLELLLTGFDENGGPVESADKRMEIDLPPDRYASVLEEGFVYSLQVPVRRSGAAHVRAAVRDVASGHIGSTSAFLLLPELKKNRLVIGAVVMGSDGDAFGNPAVREFKVGQPIPYRFSLIDPKKEPNGASRIETQTRVFRDGKQMWESQPSNVVGTSDAAKDLLVAKSVLKLPDDLDPGDYYLQVEARDLLAGDRAKPASQWLSFTLQRH